MGMQRFDCGNISVVSPSLSERRPQVREFVEFAGMFRDVGAADRESPQTKTARKPSEDDVRAAV